MKILLVIIMTSIAALADSKIEILKENISLQVDLSSKVRCKQGSNDLYKTNTYLEIDIPSEFWGNNFSKHFVNNVYTIRFNAGLGASCMQFNDILNNVSHGIYLSGERIIYERFKTQFGTKCLKSFEDHLTLRIKNSEITLTGVFFFDIGYIDFRKCKID